MKVRKAGDDMGEGKRWEPSGFAGRLQLLRERAGLTQAELAERAGCFPLTISKLERGVQEPAWPLVVCLAHALDVSCDAFRTDLPVGKWTTERQKRGPGRPAKAAGIDQSERSESKATKAGKSKQNKRKG